VMSTRTNVSARNFRNGVRRARGFRELTQHGTSEVLSHVSTSTSHFFSSRPCDELPWWPKGVRRQAQLVLRRREIAALTSYKLPFRMKVRDLPLSLACFMGHASHAAQAWTHDLSSLEVGFLHRHVPRCCVGTSQSQPRRPSTSSRSESTLIYAEYSRDRQSWALANASAEALDLEEQLVNGQSNVGAVSSRSGRRPPVAAADSPEGKSSPFLLQRRRITHSPDQVAKTTLGDIMSMGLITGTGSPPASSAVNGDGIGGLSRTAEEDTLAKRYGIRHPLDRMALTANGNLQRLICSYYDAPVSVTLDRQYRERDLDLANRSEQGDNSQTIEEPTEAPRNGDRARSATNADSSSASHVWHRVVHLSVFDRTFCTATSVITVHDPTCQALVESGKVGLGQLFRYLDLLPEFTLLGAGRMDEPATSSQTPRQATESTRTHYTREGGGGDFWREYRLDCNELSCYIREEFCPGLWDLRPLP
jgi:hypothetical protein